MKERLLSKTVLYCVFIILIGIWKLDGPMWTQLAIATTGFVAGRSVADKITARKK